MLYSPLASLKTQRSQRYLFFSFAVERTANENHQPLRGQHSLMSKNVHPFYIFKAPEGLLFFPFWPLSRKGKENFNSVPYASLRSLAKRDEWAVNS
jgi:hypothetical protein